MQQAAADHLSVAVVGLGYVGLPLAVSLAEAGVRTVGFDVDPAVVRGLAEGKSHIGDIAGERLGSVLATTLTVASEPAALSSCNTFVLCVPTPLTKSGRPDTSYISGAVETITPYVRVGSLVILESTSYPGTTEELVAQPLANALGLAAGTDFCVAFSPERIDPGNAGFGIGNTPKIVSGLQECCRSRALAVYGHVASSLVPASGLREAELAKLLENTYRQVNIALMNEMSIFCRALDIDLYEAIRCAATKPFGFQAFYPGPGVGGHCIPIDPKFLAAHVQSQLGHAFRFVELAQEINEGMPAYVVNRLEAEMGGTIAGEHIVVLGATYKRDVADMRQSPSEDVVRELRARNARVSYVDPFVDEWVVDGTAVEAWSSLHSGARASILMQHHSAFEALDIESIAPLCLDTRGALVGGFVRRL